MNDLLKEWGAPGVIIAVLATYYAIKDRANQKTIEKLSEQHKEAMLKIDGLHREERKEQSRVTEKQFENVNRLINESNGIIMKMNLLIESIKR